MNDDRGPWYLLTGLVIGIILGVVYAWKVQPVEYFDTAPASLRGDFKEKYRALIASAYVSNGDLVRARARLELLGDDDYYRSLAEQAQRTLAEDGSADEARALGLLALALGKENTEPPPATTAAGATPTSTPTSTPTPTASPTLTATPTETPTPTATFTETPLPTDTPLPQTTAPPAATQTPDSSPTPENDGTPTETPIPRPTNTPAPTRTPTPTPGGPFILVKREKSCSQQLDEPLFQVNALNALGQPVPGVEVIVTWEGGEERFFTGLKPEMGSGYADFTPLPDIFYTLRLGEGGEPVPDLYAFMCELPGGIQYWGAWRLEFLQP